MAVARHYIAQEWVEDAAQGRTSSIDPGTGDVLGDAALGSAALAGQAVAAAREAFETTSWASDMRRRHDVLLAFAARLEARREEIARLLVRENGKVLAQARHEVAAAVSEARYYAGLARNVFGRTMESAPGRFSFLTREAAGVVSVIVPWNAPVTLLVRSLAPALAAGCTTVIKPAPQTPLVNAEVVRCLEGVEALPKGVVNSVNENGIEVGTVLASHPEIDVVTFTGSSRTGKVVMEKAAPTLKRLSLELGGKSPALVFDDADLDRAVAEIRRAAIVITGQMCTAVSRVLVHEPVAAELGARLKTAFESVAIGHGLEQGSEMGPLIDRANQTRVLKLMERIADEAAFVLRGRAPEALQAGAYITPAIFRIEDVASPLVQDEHFCPMVSLETFESEDEAVARANATRYGLAASLYTRELNRAMRVSRRLRMGTVWLNSHNRQMAEAETGGYRQSGMGRLHGAEAMHDFLETKHVYLEADEG